MSAGLILPVSGPYLGTFAGYSMGIGNDDGYALACTLTGQAVDATDAYGMTMIEAIYRGQNWRARFRGMDWQKGLVEVMQGFGHITGIGSGDLSPFLDNVGDIWTSFAAALVLAAILGDPPTAPQSLTAAFTSFAPNTTSEFLMTSKVRELPVEMAMFPHPVTISGTPFVVPFLTA
jgi:hypothetical protein